MFNYWTRGLALGQSTDHRCASNPATSDGEEHARNGSRWTGANLTRKDADRFVTGTIDYAADLIRPGALFVSLLRSPHAHALIKRIDVSAAAAAPGVVSILTGLEARSLSRPMPTRVPRERFPGPIDVWCLAADEVLYAGQPVAAVVAERLADAEAAISLIEIDYELLDAVLDAQQGSAAGSPTARKAWSTNIVFQDKIRRGDAQEAMKRADCVVRGSMSFGSATTAPMECRCYVADWDPRSGKLTLEGTMQQPHPTRWMLAQALDLPETSIRVVAPAMGGTFGLKMVGHPEEVIVSVLSRQLGRPSPSSRTARNAFLPMAASKLTNLRSPHGSDGKIVAFRDFVRADVGTIGAGGGWLMSVVTPTVFPTVYDITDCSIDSIVVTTNKPPWQGVRGYGKETANVVMERAIELSRPNSAWIPLKSGGATCCIRTPSRTACHPG